MLRTLSNSSSSTITSHGDSQPISSALHIRAPKRQLKPQRPILDLHSPEELVDKALFAVQKCGIELIEWRSLLYRRMGVPILVRDFSYLVPDDKLESASTAISDIGIPLIKPPQLLLDSYGDFFTKGCIHQLTRDTSLNGAQYLIIYPSSFASFSLDELDESPRMTSLPSPLCETILVPRPSAVYASIIRTMSKYPLYSPTRNTLESDLSELIGYNLYDLQGGYVDVDDEELCEELHVDQRIDDATRIIQDWGCHNEWREGEEWIGDALIALVKGTADSDFLPWAPGTS